MFFFVGWPQVVPLKNSEVVDIEHNASKVWTVILTKDRISVWTFALNQNILLGFLKRSDIDKYGENHFVLWSSDSRKIAVITTKLCVYLYNMEEINAFVITNANTLLLHQNTDHSHTNTTSLIPKVKKIRIVPYKLLHLMKLPPYSTITRACHLTNDVFVISTNHAQFIHIHWKGHVELTCQLNLKNKAKDEDTISETPMSDNNPNEKMYRHNSLPLVRDNKNDAIGIVDLSMSSKLGIMVVVFESGSCWIIPLQKLSKNVATHNLSVNQTTYCSEYENVTCCDICDRFHFLALGLSNGNTIIYHLNLEMIPSQGQSSSSTATKLQFRLQLLVIFSAHDHNLIPPQTSSLDDVREVSWSDSGTALAIAWKKGVVVYSVRGIVIFSTLHHQMEGSEKEKEEDPVTTYYPSCLQWLQKDCGFVMVTHKQEVTKDDFNHYLKQYEIDKKLKQNANENDEERNDDAYHCSEDAYLIQIQCLKHTVGNLSQSDVSKLALLGDNYVSIWRAVHIIDDPESTDYWSRIQIDPHYLSRNWPIRELAVNARSDCFAVAGSTGFAMYFRKSARWRIVGSLDGERVLFVCVMCWFNNDVLFIATFDPSFRPSATATKQSKWNLLCFDRCEIDKHFTPSESLPNAAMSGGESGEFVPMMQYPLTNHPIGMEAVDGDKLLIYFVDGVIHVYHILRVGDARIALKNYCVLAPFQTLSPHPVCLRIWNYGSHHDDNNINNNNKANAGFCILSLNASRSLYRINPMNNERELITHHVHDFYLMKETRDKRDQCYLWTYSENEVKRWEVRCGDSSDGYKAKVECLFVSPVQAHMTCIGICNTLNVLVYGRRIIRRAQPLYTARFAIHIDIRSYLHVTIKEKLNSIGLEPTFDFVLKAIAGGAWRCLNALEHMLRSSLQKRYKMAQKELKMAQRNRNNNNNNINATSSSDDAIHENSDATLPFDQDALLLQQSLRSTYVFYPNDVERDFSRQNLRANLSDEANAMNDAIATPSNINTEDHNKETEAAMVAMDDAGLNEAEKEDNDGASINETLMMMNTMSFDEEKKEDAYAYVDDATSFELQQEEEKEIDIVIKFLHKFPDYPGIVVNVARKTEPSHWNDLYQLCGSPITLIEKSIARNQLAAASKYLYVFEKIRIEYAIHYATLLIELAIQSGSHNLVLSLLRFSHKLKLMIKESHQNNIEIPQLNINID